MGPRFLAVSILAFAAAGPARAAAPAVRVRPVPGKAGSVVEHRQITLHGLPVRRAHETVVRTPTGVRVVSVVRPSHAPDLLPSEARISADAAVEAARAELGLAAPPTVERAPQLVYIDVLGHPVLAWEVATALRTRPEPSRKTLWIGAAGGVLVAEREEVFASKATVYPTNPAASPEPVTVELSDIAADGPGVPLISPRLRAMNCSLEPPDDPDLIEPWWDEGECYAVHRVFSDENGNFFVPLPDVRLEADNVDGDDLYAELSIYVHAERFFDALVDRGVETFPCEFSTMLANFRYTEPAVSYPELAFGPLNNAYYTNQCDPDKGVTMLFGQGSSIDFAFDGDVVYHELGHGVTSDLSPDGLWDSRYRRDGLLRDARGINEAVADYLSAMVAGDPYLADYVGRYWPSYTRPYIRSARNQKRCPDDTIGQEHNDGEPLMGAMWTTREQVGPAFDQVVLRMLPRLPGDADLESAAAALLEVMDEMIDEGVFDAADRAVLYRALDARGLIDCPRVLTDPVEVAGGHTMWLRRKTSGVEPFLPGPIQLRHEIPEGSDNFVLSFKLTPRGTSTGNPIEDPVSSKVLVKFADASIEFTYDLVSVVPDGDAKEIVLVGGDWDATYEPSVLDETQRQVVVRGLLPGQVVHVSLVNDETTADAIASSVRIVSLPADELDEGATPDGGPGDPGGTSGAAGEDAWDASDPSSSCACRSGDGDAPWAWILPVVACRHRRRRKGGR
ncbi:MAG: hypothetical protein D6705_01995 [Deltaproteobacteria bacterium]|nr:MAG: hypothetical protein D6705_01995 [Deltaproteobacteria bacterium]